MFKFFWEIKSPDGPSRFWFICQQKDILLAHQQIGLGWKSPPSHGSGAVVVSQYWTCLTLGNCLIMWPLEILTLLSLVQWKMLPSYLAFSPACQVIAYSGASCKSCLFRSSDHPKSHFPCTPSCPGPFPLLHPLQLSLASISAFPGVVCQSTGIDSSCIFIL